MNITISTVLSQANLPTDVQALRETITKLQYENTVLIYSLTADVQALKDIVAELQSGNSGTKISIQLS